MDQHFDIKLRDILNKYLEEEKELETRIRECENMRQSLKSKDCMNNSADASSILNLRYQRETSQARNQKLIKDLEKAKAILRTMAAFTPTDQELHDLAATYRNYLQN